jgi:hypothetical protein
MYKKFPKQMLRARVISEGVRMVLPGVVVGIYTEAEIEDMSAGYTNSEPLSPPQDRKQIPPKGTPPPEDFTVVGQKAQGADPRPFHAVVTEAVDEAERQWRDHQGRAGVEEPKALAKTAEVQKALLKRAIEAELTPEPASGATIKRGEMVSKLADVYVKDRQWLREALATLLDEIARDAATELQVRLDAEQGDDVGEEPVQDIANGD